MERAPQVSPDLCPKCHAQGVMALLDGLTCAMNHGATSQAWAVANKVPALEDQPGFVAMKKPAPAE